LSNIKYFPWSEKGVRTVFHPETRSQLPLTFSQMAQKPGLKLGQPIRYGEGAR
jgi:hypothetical protein